MRSQSTKQFLIAALLGLNTIQLNAMDRNEARDPKRQRLTRCTIIQCSPYCDSPAPTAIERGDVPSYV